GVWGSYPFLPSGKILSSDRTSGLFVFIPNYVRAAFLEGTVIDSITKLPIQGATVTILSDEIILPQSTKIDGTFKTGKAIPGSYAISVFKTGYHKKVITAFFINGDVLTPLFELNPLQVFSYGGKVLNPNGNPLPNARVVLSGEQGIFEATSDANGDFLIPAVFEGEYDVQAGVWGATAEFFISLNQTEIVTLQVESGYKDDFDLDLGWVVSGVVAEGPWTRGIPTKQLLFDNWLCGSGEDSPNDVGSQLYSTGLSTSPQAQNDEVSHGTTVLSSPSMDLDTVLIPRLSFDYWLCELPPNQFVGFTVLMAAGDDTTLIAEFTNDSIFGAWITYTTDLLLTGSRDDVRIIFSARDTTSGSGDYYLKVHVDNFKLIEGATGTYDPSDVSGHFLIYPNPVDGDLIYLKPDNTIIGDQLTIRLMDIQGKVIRTFD
ncbi:MAG: carboxypeptidase regulatory-like domain-containing protein, partial [Bacteroidota bacterium]|nr:carboxypeptidase regulatory-like domain-containing protein [Bacteroidota bacterium]